MEVRIRFAREMGLAVLAEPITTVITEVLAATPVGMGVQVRAVEVAQPR